MLGGNMRSWVLLLLLAAFLAARVRLGSAEGDPLPPSLVDLVRDSPISSVEDLKLLLQQETNAIEEEEDEHDVLINHTHGRYTRSLVEAQPAQQAACKVRTEVMEVKRSMLDRRNANFLLWPPCVEVQRCSGCCNTRMLQCTATVTSTRYLQVIKIQYINRKAHYDKAIISVEDHVSCRCQPPSSPSSPSSVAVPQAFPSNPNPPPPPPQQQQPPPSAHVPPPVPQPAHPAPAAAKPHSSKADLHRHDDLKRNQQQQHYHPEEPVSRQWQQGGYTQLVHWTQPRVHQAPTHVQQQQPGVHQAIGSSWPSEARGEHSVMGSAQPERPGSGYDGSREEGGAHGDASHPDHAQRQQQLLLQHQQRQQQQHQYRHQPHYAQQYNHGGADDQELRTQYRLNTPQADSSSAPLSPTQLPEPGENPTPPLTTVQKDSATGRNVTAVTRQKQTETVAVSQKEGSAKEDGGSANSGDSAGPEPAGQGKGRDSKATGGDLTEQERRERLLEVVQGEPGKQNHLHPHHPQQRPKPTAFKTALSTAAPVSPAARQAPLRPASPRRRRKHRKRISKAAMRAMIM